MKRCILPLMVLMMMTSCAEVASTIVEGGLRDSLESGQKNHPRTAADDKAENKKREQLKKEGKCPTCRGMGKTPDGKYECTVCKGTGKYIETDNKQ